MQDIRNRIEDAKWLLERMLSWIAAADVKTGIVLTIQIAMFGGLAATYSTADMVNRSSAAYLFVALAYGSLISAASCAAVAAMPRISGPIRSNIYFGRIVTVPVASFNAAFEKLNDATFLQDLTTQIHRNAEIANLKHAWVRSSIEWTFCSSIPWSVAILLLI
ncbi:Pycsar system effector family protein [Methylophilus flavus]|uniref:Pycsar system effector family protein n=1 Tax=Methylophilus flavus TaxID=640084 RepID=A0ABW3PDZ1_9PROT